MSWDFNERRHPITHARIVRPLDKQSNLIPIEVCPEVRRAHTPRLPDKEIQKLERQQLLLNYLRVDMRKSYSSAELRQVFGGSQSLIVNYLNKLRRLGYAERSGRNGLQFFYFATGRIGDLL